MRPSQTRTLRSTGNLLEPLYYLKGHNEHYQDIEINLENANAYPVHVILQTLPSLNPLELGIPPEQPTAVNEDLAREEASTVDCPRAANTILDAIQLALRENRQQGEDQADHQEQRPAQADNVLQWPTRAREPASEFIAGYFSKAFPDLFPDGKGDLRMPRIKNPTLQKYFHHIMRMNRDFVKHHCFAFVAMNMLRRHEALTLGNVFAKELPTVLPWQISRP
jgi:hypothetical protein